MELEEACVYKETRSHKKENNKCIETCDNRMEGS